MINRFAHGGHKPDYFLIAVVFILTIFGLAMLASASSDLGKMKFNDSYYYLKHQIFYGLSVGIVGFALGYLIYYRYLKKIAFPLLILSIGTLTLVFTKFGLELQNANRWLKIGPLSFQPAEVVKLVFIIYLAAWLSNVQIKRAKNFSEGLVPFLLVSALIAGLLVMQPATSTVVILMATALIVYALSGAKKRYIIAAVTAGLLCLAIVIYVTPYRKARILGFLNPQDSESGQNYQVAQATMAIGSGGLFGAGYGQSTTKASTLPAPTDDSIFAVIGEELGFVGGGSVVVLFGLLTFRLVWIGMKCRDQFGRLMLAGFGALIAFQSFVNMGAISGLLPLTGVPLPFVSYGGTALASFLTMMGIAVNVSRYA
jgi:cell division protein FtsW